MRQIILGILANAGGVGKTTLATHLAYELSRQKLSVGLIDLDPQRCLDVFCGLPSVEEDRSIVRVFSKEFTGNWDLTPVWDSSVEVCQGNPEMREIGADLRSRKRGSYILSDRLRKYPLNYDVLILDCPATTGPICENAVSASTHLLIPFQLEMKSISGVDDLLFWLSELSEELLLEPPPEILGLVPSLYDSKKSMHRQYLEQMPEVGERLGLKIYPEIRNSAEFINCCANGLPLQKYRPNHPAIGDFKVLTQDIVKLVKTGV